MFQKFYVLLVDIVGSMKMADRDVATEKLIATNTKVNVEFQDDMYAPMEITRGDEAASVLISVDHVYDIINRIQELMQPIRVRYVVAYETLTAGIHTRRSTEMDGPAFYLADQLMRAVKKTQRMFTIDTGHPVWDQAIDALVNLASAQMESLTPLQRRVIRLYQQKGNQKEVGRILGKSQQHISQILRDTRWELIYNAEKAIRRLLELISKDTQTYLRQF